MVTRTRRYQSVDKSYSRNDSKEAADRLVDEFYARDDELEDALFAEPRLNGQEELIGDHPAEWSFEDTETAPATEAELALREAELAKIMARDEPVAEPAAEQPQAVEPVTPTNGSTKPSEPAMVATESGGFFRRVFAAIRRFFST